MSKKPKSNQENIIKNRLCSDISRFWQQGKFDSFLGVDNVNIHYALFLGIQVTNRKPIVENAPDNLSANVTANFQKATNKDSSPTIIVVPGRGESYLKYQELAFNLYQGGYNIFILDHRGQGLSDRLLSNSNKGYVCNFQDYVDDLQYFIENIISKYSPVKPYLLAHSMGGAIAVRYMQDSPDAIKAAVISSPMLGFNSGFLPQNVAEKVVSVKLALNNIISKDAWYFLGQKNFSPISFTKNRLTHSTERYIDFLNLYKNKKEIQLGGVTTHWLMQGILAQRQIFEKLPQLKTPILLLQAGGDSVVCQQAQNNFCERLHALKPNSYPNGKPIRIEDAYHELFFEADEYREKAIKQSLSWFKQHNN